MQDNARPEETTIQTEPTTPCELCTITNTKQTQSGRGGKDVKWSPELGAYV